MSDHHHLKNIQNIKQFEVSQCGNIKLAVVQKKKKNSIDLTFKDVFAQI